MWYTVGHDRVVRRLERALSQERLAHSYLVVGPPHVGKTTLAMDLARAANCVGEPRPCGQCSQCKRIADGLHPDVRTIGLETNRSGRLRTLVSIEQVRDMQRETGLLPFEGSHRVFIFESAERLSGEAANSLLKTLEEPPDGVILVLLASDESLVLPTISSRCQRLDLRPVHPQTIVEFLVSRETVDEGLAKEIAGLSGGRVGWAVLAARDPAVLAGVRSSLDAIETVLNSPLSERFEYAERLAGRFAADRDGVIGEMKLWLEWWRDVLLVGQGKPELISNVSRMDALTSLSERISVDAAAAAVRTVNRTSVLLERNVSPRLSIEAMMLRLPR